MIRVVVTGPPSQVLCPAPSAGQWHRSLHSFFQPSGLVAFFIWAGGKRLRQVLTLEPSPLFRQDKLIIIIWCSFSDSVPKNKPPPVIFLFAQTV